MEVEEAQQLAEFIGPVVREGLQPAIDEINRSCAITSTKVDALSVVVAQHSQMLATHQRHIEMTRHRRKKLAAYFTLAGGSFAGIVELLRSVKESLFIHR